jgi:chaperonin GroES
MQNMPQLASIKREGQPEEFGADTGLPDGYADPVLYVNTSGFLPLGHRLLVKPDTVEKRTSGGLYLPQEVTGRDEMAQVKGVVVAVGEGCWKDTTSADWAKPGDRIVFGKYSGLQYDGADAIKYRILNDLDVVGLEVENATR